MEAPMLAVVDAGAADPRPGAAAPAGPRWPAEPSVVRMVERVVGAGVAAPVTLDLRERTLLCLLVAGHTDTSAARRLHVSPRTVTYMVRALMDRLGVDNRFQLGVAIGLRSGQAPGGAAAARAAGL
jgi:DNA-binding NarL/FixJ family response regulator